MPCCRHRPPLLSMLPGFPSSSSQVPPPTEVVPKFLILVFAATVFFQLFYRLAHPDVPPHPTRLGLLHADLPQNAPAALAAGLVLPSPLELARTPRVSRLSAPLGSENGALTYNARPFGEVNHLGDDLNGIGGENSDRGDPVYAIGDGIVIYAAAASEGWGNVIILQHRLPEGRLFQSFYGHLDAVRVALHDSVHRGQIIGSVGDAAGKYLAHLHFEIRDSIATGAGIGYHPLPLDRENPAKFMAEHQNRAARDLLPSLATVAKPLQREHSIRLKTALP